LVREAVAAYYGIKNKEDELMERQIMEGALGAKEK